MPTETTICGNCAHFQLIRNRTVYSPQHYRCGLHGIVMDTPTFRACGTFTLKHLNTMIGDTDGMQWREANPGEVTQPKFERAFVKSDSGLDKYAMCNSVGAITIITRHIDGGYWIETMCDEFDTNDGYARISELEFMQFYNAALAAIQNSINN
jgi:hypothetical protein